MVDGRRVRNFYVLCCLSALAACSNGRGSVDSDPAPPSGGAQGGFTVGGTIAGLDGDGLVLQLNGSNDLAVSNNGTFTFPTQLADAAAYAVTVLTPPSGPSQTCTVGSGTGTIAAANVTNVAITCATGAFALRVTVSGLLGSGLVLQANGANDLPIGANGDFSFAAPFASGSAYSVTVLTPPSGPSQSCALTNGTGTIGSADVNVGVSCATGTFAIGGSVSGLSGSGLQLQSNGGTPIDIGGNGPFQFGDLLASGATYNVTVARQPTSPTQNCAVANNSGTIGSSSVTNIAVTCMTDRFTVGGAITGLVGTGLRLQLNNQPPLNVPAAAASFTFPTLLASGSAYAVKVDRNPSNPAQDCSVSPATQTGIVPGQNVTNVAVTCTTRSSRIGGTVSGLQGDGLVLRNNDGETLAIASNGDFFFSNLHLSGSQYQVAVQTLPSNPSQTCTIANGSGTVGSGDVRNVRVTCAVATFKVGGTVSGLLGSGLTLQNNGGNNLNVGADGSFQFTTGVASGAAYNVTIGNQPSNPTQACSVANGSGTVGGGDVASVVINCSTSNFTVGGSIDNLVGSGLVLQNNGADDVRIDSGNGFTFPIAVPSGAPYNVTVATQPTGPAQSCSVANGSGTVGGAPVTSVQISCVTTEFSIGGTVSDLTGSGLVLQNNGDDSSNLAVASSGPFKFTTSLPSGSPYNVVVLTQPNSPTQVCIANNGVGIVSGADVTTVDVSCTDAP
jgi:large repetitive protein